MIFILTPVWFYLELMGIVTFNPFYFLKCFPMRAGEGLLLCTAFPRSQACSGQCREGSWPPRLPPPLKGGQRCWLQVPRAPGGQCHPASGHAEARPGDCKRHGPLGGRGCRRRKLSSRPLSFWVRTCPCPGHCMEWTPQREGKKTGVMLFSLYSQFCN